MILSFFWYSADILIPLYISNQIPFRPFYPAAQLAGTLFEKQDWWVGHFPQPSFRLGQLVGLSQLPQRGETSFELIQVLTVLLTNILHEEPVL